MLTNLATGTIYANPQAHIKSVHAYFPSVACLPSGELIATYVLGEAFEATNARLHVSRSTDRGDTWTAWGPLKTERTSELISESGRISIDEQGQPVVLWYQCDRREHPDDGLSNPENMGFVPTSFHILRSSDDGRTWTKPHQIEPPVKGCEFELCSPITIIKDGMWLLPTSTWKRWNGQLDPGYKMLALVSRDKGATWPEAVQPMSLPGQSLIFWESKIVEFADGTLLAQAWTHNYETAKDSPNHYSLSKDAGKTWSLPQSTGILGQTMTQFVLDDGRLINVYRRMDETGLWATVAHLEGDRWVNDETIPLWGQNAAQLTGRHSSMVDNFRVLRFGAPCINRLDNGEVFVAFWCYEDAKSVIRWFRFGVR
ncbi:MAG: sialidase family protein [Planctomycetaceae bacterium]